MIRVSVLQCIVYFIAFKHVEILNINERFRHKKIKIFNFKNIGNVFLKIFKAIEMLIFTLSDRSVFLKLYDLTDPLWYDMHFGDTKQFFFFLI